MSRVANALGRVQPWQLKKKFNPNQPRDEVGRWVRDGAIIAAAGDAVKAEQLLHRVTDPEEREKLDEASEDVKRASMAEKKPERKFVFPGLL